MDIFRWMRQQWDRTAAIAVLLLGLLSLLFGWLGVSRSSLPAEQIPYLASGAVFGLFALGVAATLWLSADLRDEWRKLDEIHRGQAGGPDDDVDEPHAPSSPGVEQPQSTNGRVRTRPLAAHPSGER